MFNKSSLKDLCDAIASSLLRFMLGISFHLPFLQRVGLLAQFNFARRRSTYVLIIQVFLTQVVKAS